MEDEENLFGLVALTKENVIVEQVETFKLWNDTNKEVLGLVSEESDSFNDLTVGLLDNVSSKGWRQLREQSLPIAVVSDGSSLVFEEVLNFRLGVDGQVVLERVLREGVKFGIEQGCLGVHAGDDATDVADRERVEVDTNEHPQECQNILALGRNREVSIPDSGNCLYSPV